MENASTSLKIITNAYLNTNCDIRAFYSISNSSQANPVYAPFPGYDNIDYKGDVIDPADNDGKSDEYITLSPNEEVNVSNINFKEYTFTATELPSFKFYRIKIVMTSTSQTFPPRLQDLRVLALA